MQFFLDDSRRLTGPNLLSDRPGAVIDVLFAGVDHATVIHCWQRHIRRYMDAVEWHNESSYTRCFANPDGRLGATLAITAPIDVLYAATEVNEAAWAAVTAELSLTRTPDFSAQLAQLQQMIADEANPALLRLQDAAARHSQPFLSDDDEVSAGYGGGAVSWPVNNIPEVDSIDWPTISAIPLALITGTNGKSTSVRLAASVVEVAGKKAGTTSTDFIKVGHRVLDTGDYSGPGGARTLLRHPDVDIAMLEVARGGILRRGLGVQHADAALITNVASDHLGEYGINTVPDLIETKFVVRRALSADGILVLNADDAGMVNYVEQQQLASLHSLCWFSESMENPLIQSQLDNGGRAVTINQNKIILINNGQCTDIADLTDIPITLNGAARHNVQNCLGVAGLCAALGITPQAIAEGLKAFSSNPDANPGRGNLFSFDGRQALVDFAHNEHGYSAMAETVGNLPAKRRLVMLAQAGDRSDEDIRAMTAVACRLKPDKIIICSLTDYLRGRPEGEVEAVIRDEILHQNLPVECIYQAASTWDGVQHALQWSQPGDLLFLQVLTDRQRILSHISSL